MAEQAYQVIARRWRPKQFDELVGQDHIVRTLTNAIESGRIAHAFLFVGPRGTGKTTTARLLAKALNAEAAPTVKPDNSSDLAQSILRGECMDVIEIDGASNNSVEQVRSLREDCQYAPAQCRFKIYIIDEVHMLSAQAFNALLKTLEEPPAHVKFIFATTEAHKVLPTIVSRCQRFEFRPIDDATIAAQLGRIATAEEIDVDAAALQGIAALAQGGMRDAQSILDQLISFCGKTIREQDVLDVYGLVAPETVERLATAVATGDTATLLDEAGRIAAEGRDLFQALRHLQARFRTALLAAARSGQADASLGRALGTEALLRILEALRSGEEAVKTGLSEAVHFEVTLLQAAEAGQARAIDQLLRELTGMAEKLPEDTPSEAGDGKKKRPTT